MLERRELAPGYGVPPVINGCWQLAEGHRAETIDGERAVRRLARLVEAGLDTFDCGDIYTGVETLLGRLARRERIRVHTKFVPDLDVLPRIDRAYVERIVDRSLTRLGVERLDLVQFAWWDYRVPRYVETAHWLDELRRAGKIRRLGATNFDTPRLRELLDAGLPLVCHQVQYSPLDRRPERGMAALCGERGVRLLAYGTLAGGFLSERFLGRAAPEEPLPNRSLTKYRLMIEELGGWSRLQELLRTLARVGARHGVGIAAAALAWVLDRPQVVAAIVGTRDDRHLQSTLAALEVRLDDADRAALARFEDAGPRGDVYAVEREPGSAHAAIMRYNLNRELNREDDR